MRIVPIDNLELPGGLLDRIRHSTCSLLFGNGRPVSYDDLEKGDNPVTGGFMIGDGEQFGDVVIRMWKDEMAGMQSAAIIGESYRRAGLPMPELFVVKIDNSHGKRRETSFFAVDWEGR